MKSSHKKALGFAIIVIAASVVTTTFVAKSAKPKLYHGRTVTEWVARLDPHVGHQKQREEAAWEIVQIKAAALPDLERILAWRRNALLETVQGYAIRFHLAKPPSLTSFELQRRACEAAYNLAKHANVDISSLVPQLSYHFTNGANADINAGLALAQAGPAGIAVLTNLLLVGPHNLRDYAGGALRHVRSRPEVIAALVSSAETETNLMLRANAMLYLSRSRAPAVQLVPLGLKRLQSDDGYERWAAASMLVDYADLPDVRVALEQAKRDADPRVRDAAERALQSSQSKSGR
jgi:hypothetical protein